MTSRMTPSLTARPFKLLAATVGSPPLSSTSVSSLTRVRRVFPLSREPPRPREPAHPLPPAGCCCERAAIGCAPLAESRSSGKGARLPRRGIAPRSMVEDEDDSMDVPLLPLHQALVHGLGEECMAALAAAHPPSPSWRLADLLRARQFGEASAIARLASPEAAKEVQRMQWTNARRRWLRTSGP